MSDQSTKAMARELKTMVSDAKVQKGFRKVAELGVFNVRGDEVSASRARTSERTKSKPPANNP